MSFRTVPFVLVWSVLLITATGMATNDAVQLAQASAQTVPESIVAVYLPLVLHTTWSL